MILQKKSSCFNHWVVTLVAGDNDYEKFVLLIAWATWVQIIPYNWQSSEQLWVTTNDDFVVILSQRLLYLQHNIIACSLMYMRVWPLSKMDNQWLLYLQDQVVEGLGSFLSGCLMQMEKHTIHNHCLFSLSATRCTLWSKQQISRFLLCCAWDKEKCSNTSCPVFVVLN